MSEQPPPDPAPDSAADPAAVLAPDPVADPVPDPVVESVPDPVAEGAPADSPVPATGAVDQAAIDELLNQASFEDVSATAVATAPDLARPAAGEPASAANAATQEYPLPDFQQVLADANVSSVDLLRDVDLNVKIELGRTRMLVEDVLKLAEGSVVELDKLAGDPVDVFVNERLVARGEVLVLNDNFCVRINEIVAGVKEEGL
jgi:flagellar motor switch protein FliN